MFKLTTLAQTMKQEKINYDKLVKFTESIYKYLSAGLPTGYIEIVYGKKFNELLGKAFCSYPVISTIPKCRLFKCNLRNLIHYSYDDVYDYIYPSLIHRKGFELPVSGYHTP